MQHLQKIHRRFVTLLEVLIAMGLITILLTVLLGIYGQTVRTQQHVEQALQSNFQLLYAQFRLNQVIPTIINPVDDKDHYGYAFYTQDSDSLVFTYDNGTGSGTFFSNEVIGRLFLDENKRLMFLTWPVPKRYPDVEPPVRTEVLLENVDELSFNFYRPVPIENKRLAISSERATGEYGDDFDTWNADEEDIPAIIRIYVTIKGRQVEYAFLLSNASTPVSYL